MRDLLEGLCEAGRRLGAQFVDIRAEESESTSISQQDRKADKIASGRSCGIGIRVLVDGAWGFGASQGLDRTNALDCVSTAVSIARASRRRVTEAGVLASVQAHVAEVHTPFIKDPRSVSLQVKMKAVNQYEQAAIAAGAGKLVNTLVSYRDHCNRTCLCNTNGAWIDTETVRTMLFAMMTAADGEVRQHGHKSHAMLAGYESIEELTPEETSVRAAKQAVSLLSAVRAPSGRFTVVFDPNIAGLLTHEALGHNAEADLVLSGDSILAGKVGTKIASDCITIVDDATIPGSWGSYAYDSEGVPGQRRVLIDKGVLKGFMHGLETAARMGCEPNGSCRADGCGNAPIVRMSNTFIVPGQMSFEELLRDIDDGVYLKLGQWGYVFCERGQYTCSAGEGYRIRNGQIAEHLRDVCISGLTLETLMNADAVSNDFEMKFGGWCGKSGQGMPVDCGGPHVRVRDIVVGGQADREA